MTTYGQLDRNRPVTMADATAALATPTPTEVLPSGRKKPGGRRRTLAAIERDARALELFCQSKSYTEIARILGWKNRTSAYEAVRRALADRQRASFTNPEEFTAAVARNRALYAACQEIAATPHYLATSTGKIAMMTDPDTGREVPVLDDGPRQRAIDRMQALDEQLNTLLDLKPPAKKVVNVITQSAVDEQLAAELAEISRLAADAGEPPYSGVIREP